MGSVCSWLESARVFAFCGQDSDLLFLDMGDGIMIDAVCPDEVASVIANWKPARISAADKASLEAHLPQLRDWVSATAPQTEAAARGLLYAGSRLLLWMGSKYGVTDARSVLNRDTINNFIFAFEQHRDDGWKASTRSALNSLRRTLIPDEWERLTVPISARPTTAGYSKSEELGFRVSASLPGYRNPTARKWVTAAALGAGLNGREIAESRVEDAARIADTRIAVQVGGRRPRLVPIRDEYSELAAEAIESARQGPFLTGRGANSAYDIASRLNGGLSLARARSTWLSAHLQQGTPLPALQLIAGSVSPKTLGELSGRLASSLTPLDAATQGLKP